MHLVLCLIISIKCCALTVSLALHISMTDLLFYKSMDAHCGITTPQQCLLMPLVLCSNKRLQQLQQQQQEQKKSRRQCVPSGEPLLGRFAPELPAPPATMRSLSMTLPTPDTKVGTRLQMLAAEVLHFASGIFVQV